MNFNLPFVLLFLWNALECYWGKEDKEGKEKIKTYSFLFYSKKFLRALPDGANRNTA